MLKGLVGERMVEKKSATRTCSVDGEANWVERECVMQKMERVRLGVR